ncbi:hypothetical protein [Arsukibacterium sp.]|uniref:hypothetical protein n=1 Tax=Arsukibacterium sp. TaxID=1977258 RepID=UPI00299D9AAC|nr:hypothetical protein [Arsukibacterium sp.]MDX1677494.1 hypothetical protein [Arsukibacterium sp.]
MANQGSPSVAADLFCGAGIGVLLGTLVGLSANEVVAELVVGIVAILAAALGLVSASEKIGARPWRIGAFGFFATVSVIVALMVRTHDSLAPSAMEQHRLWTAIGFSEREAAELVAYRQLGLKPDGAQLEPQVLKGKAAVLYAADAETCRDLAPGGYSDNAELLNAWSLQQGAWADVAAIAVTLSPEQARLLLAASWALACSVEAP